MVSQSPSTLHQSSERTYVRFPAALSWCAAIGILFTCISLLYACLHSHPLASRSGFKWLYFPGPAWDYYDYLNRVMTLHTQEFFSQPGYTWYYPAGAILPLQLFYKIGWLGNDWHVGYFAYAEFAVFGGGFAAWRLARAMQESGIRRFAAFTWCFLMLLFSWPIYFSLERGNIEAVTWLVFAAAVWAYRTGRWTLAACLLGLVSAFKLYPALCFGLFLPARQWKPLLTGVVTMAGVTLLSYWYIGPTIPAAFNGVANGMSKWVNDYALSYGPASATYDHSLYELVKVCTLPLHPNYDTLLHVYLVSAALIASAVFFLRVRHLSRTNQIVFLVTLTVFLSPASFDYTLQNLYIAFGWLTLVFVRSRQQALKEWWLTVCMLAFAVIFAPETFAMQNDMTVAGLLKCFFVLFLVIISAVAPFPDLHRPEGYVHVEPSTA